MLNINEIFGPTIQGEGKLVGTPSIFIRFSKCNLNCRGFGVEYETSKGKKFGCDTFYAVDSHFKDSWEKYENYEEIVKEVEKLTNDYDYKLDIVITGGEPLLYWEDEEFQKLLIHYIKNGHQVTIETNASLNINFKHEYQKNILFSMSVKLSNSNEPFEKRVNYKTISEILKNTNSSYLKFVVNNKTLDKTNSEIKQIVSEVPKCDVYLMPMGETEKSIKANCEDIIDLAIKNGYKYCDRLHIRVWDDKRGV